MKKGYRVAVCDQVEDPRKAKGIVKREVTRVHSPGTFTDPGVSRGARAGVSRRSRGAGRRRRRRGDWRFSTVSTGEFAAAEFAGPARVDALAAELAVLRPRELLAAADRMSTSFLTCRTWRRRA